MLPMWCMKKAQTAPCLKCSCKTTKTEPEPEPNEDQTKQPLARWLCLIIYIPNCLFGSFSPEILSFDFLCNTAHLSQPAWQNREDEDGGNCESQAWPWRSWSSPGQAAQWLLSQGSIRRGSCPVPRSTDPRKKERPSKVTSLTFSHQELAQRQKRQSSTSLG
jgi:hypothetical protein